MPLIAHSKRRSSLKQLRLCEVEDVSNSNSSTFDVRRGDGKTSRPISPASRPTVSFRDTVEVKLTINLGEYSDSERISTWYTLQEYKEMKLLRKATIKRMNAGDLFVEDGDDFFRGLEHKTKAGMRRRQFNQVEASMAVMEEQEAQMQLGRCDPDMIARAYMSSSFSCGTEAVERGLKDQRAAADIFDGLSLTETPRRRSMVA